MQLEVLSHWRLALVWRDIRHGRALAHHRGVDHQPHVAQSATHQPSICIPPSIRPAPPPPAHTYRGRGGQRRGIGNLRDEDGKHQNSSVHGTAAVAKGLKLVVGEEAVEITIFAPCPAAGAAESGSAAGFGVVGVQNGHTGCVSNPQHHELDCQRQYHQRVQRAREVTDDVREYAQDGRTAHRQRHRSDDEPPY